MSRRVLANVDEWIFMRAKTISLAKEFDPYWRRVYQMSVDKHWGISYCVSLLIKERFDLEDEAAARREKNRKKRVIEAGRG